MDPAQELVDVVDEDDRVVATVTRRDVRERNLLHRCTYVLLRNAAGEMLVHRRTDTKDVHPGAYDVFSGGVCGAGESYDDCARRELAEEFGVVGADLRCLFRHRYRGPLGQAWGAVFEARWEGAVSGQESEVAWHAWVAPDQLDSMLDRAAVLPRLARDLRPPARPLAAVRFMAYEPIRCPWGRAAHRLAFDNRLPELDPTPLLEGQAESVADLLGYALTSPSSWSCSPGSCRRSGRSSCRPARRAVR